MSPKGLDSELRVMVSGHHQVVRYKFFPVFSLCQINIGLSLHLDGIIDNEGGNGTSNSGGGSGGSVLIKTVQFSGHGIVTVNGGSGHGNGGGGAGGRIAVHVAWLREYSGKYTAYGGLGS